MMKKSTRLLALLLCVVMMAALLPTFAMAADEYKLVDPKDTLNQKIITLSQDRYTVKTGGEIGYKDTGYGYETTYMFPQGKGGTAYSFSIERTQSGTGKETDLNRWWRWAKDGDVLNQRKSDSAAGYNNATPGVDDWTAEINWPKTTWDGLTRYTKTGPMQVPKDGSRSQEYILMKPLLSPRPYCFYWAGGNRTKAATCYVTIDTTKPVGTHAILWSANGTDSEHFGNFLADTKFKKGRVHYGDLGQNHMYIVEAKYVYYDLDGGTTPDGDDSNRKYPCWTTGTEKSSQKHKVIAAPSKEGYSFQGWWCEELGKYVRPGADLNNGITKDMHIVAHWKEIVVAPNYYVSFNGNGNTDADGTPSTYTMPNQGFHFNTPAELDNNQYIRQFVVTYDANKGVSPEASAIAEAKFMGWEDRGDLNGYSYTQFDAPFYANNFSDLYAAFGYDKVDLLNHYINWGTTEGRVCTGSPRGTYPNQATVSDLTNVEGAVVPLYAQWNDGSVTLPTPEREVDPNEDNDILAWRFDGWYTAASGGSLVGMGGVSYTPTDNTTLYAHWAPIKNTKYYVVHVTNGVAGNPVEYNTDNGNINFTSIVTSGYYYGGTFTEAACLNVATKTPTNFEASPGHTYYIWEVSKQHLQPVNLSTWINTNDGTGNFRVDHIYLITAVDRLLYQEAGFEINGTTYKLSDGNIAFDKIGVELGKTGTIIPLTYFQMNPNASTTQNSKAVCCEYPIPAVNAANDMKAYWITLDGVKVYGDETRTFTYIGAGNTAAHKQLTISDYSGPVAAKAAAPARNAPMMLMSMFAMGSPNGPTVIETSDVINVVDGENSYTAEAYKNSLVGLVEPDTPDGKIFLGWYCDEAFTVPADLAAVEDGDTIYAKYVSDKYLQVKYNATFTLLKKNVSITSAIDSTDYDDFGYIVTTKNGNKTISVDCCETRFALQNAKQLFGNEVAKNAPLMNAEFSVSGLSKNDKVTITPYLVTADGTTVYGTAKTLTYTGLTMKG